MLYAKLILKSTFLTYGKVWFLMGFSRLILCTLKHKIFLNIWFDFSWIMPSLLGFAEEDPILQIEVDNSRNILYTRSEKGTVTVRDIGQLNKTKLYHV